MAGNKRVMGKLTLRSLRARWIRFVLTSLAVVMGVAFVTGSFVLSDTLRKVFDTLAGSATATLDVQVRSVDALGGDDAMSAQRTPLPASLVDEVAKVDGVARAEGAVSFFAAATAPNGDSFDAGGAPVLGFNWNDDTATEDSVFKVVEGHGPRADGEMALDRASADKYDISLGDTLNIRGPGGSREFTVNGIFTFADGGAGAYYMLFTTPVAQELANLPGQFQTIDVRAQPGVNQAELRDRVGSALPDGYEAITGEQAGQEFSESFDQIVGIIRTALLVFAFVTLFVAGFLINTVFNTTVGQRVRELALLRAVGARNRQVTRSVLTESLLIGLVSSLVGVIAGIGVAKLILELFQSQGGGFPERPLVLSGTTWVIALLVGVGMTMLVSLVPAWRAGRVAPVAAMRDGYSLYSDRIRLRLVVGIIAGVIGVLVFLGSLFGDLGSTAATLSSLGLGALLIFLAVTALSPLIARPVVNVISWPFNKLYGVTGRLANGNAARNPRRTATTAAALMIGVALVSMVGVIGSSFKSSFSEQLREGIRADYFLTSQSFTGFTPEVAERMAALPEVEQVTTFRMGTVKVGDERKQVQAVQETGLNEVLNLGQVAGDVNDVPPDGLLLDKQVAEDRGLSVGDTVDMLFPVGGTQTLRLTGIFDNNVTGSNWLISQAIYRDHFPPEFQLDAFGGVTLRPDADRAQAAAALQAIADQYPEVRFEDRAEFQKTQEDQINQVAVLVNALLAFSLIIAILGIAITLALAVFERTRELGLLRAVGQRRRQTRRMVRLEAVTVATFGATLGIVLGLLFGIAISAAIPDSVMTAISVPWGQVISTLIVAAIAGVLAALLPAWRAGRLKVLDAISYE
jgi:putative ABC transport system permease protein